MVCSIQHSAGWLNVVEMVVLLHANPLVMSWIESIRRKQDLVLVR